MAASAGLQHPALLAAKPVMLTSTRFKLAPVLQVDWRASKVITLGALL